MGALDVIDQVALHGAAERKQVVNDFSLVIATVNGSGSQTANGLLVRSIFKMGIPVGSKNLFPSNISGLPTWYTIRLSKDGYTARRDISEVLVAFNPATAQDDYATLPVGGVCFHPDDMKFLNPREDVVSYPLPVKDLMKQANIDPKLRDHVANMVYVGAMGVLMGIDVEELRAGLNLHFKGKPKPVEMNMGVITMTMEWVQNNLTKQDPYRVERMQGNNDLIMIEGNTAGALGAIYGGVTVGAWYPITPSTSLFDALATYLPKLRPTVDGTQTYAIVQAEDELAAIGMVLGAGWSGARAMTSTSGPGISLMTEFAGFGYFAEIPGVIWDIQRVGPSTGLPTRTSQGDVMSTYFLGHGDTRHVILLPGSVKECFEFGWRAFDLAERLQTPIFVLSDLDLGMNVWMSEPLDYPDLPMDRGKVLSAEDISRLGSWARYEDVDGDAITYRTLPGNKHPLSAYFTRGTGHNAKAVYSERPDDWEQNLKRLERKHDTARKLVPPPIADIRPGAEVGIIAFGSTDTAIEEARDLLRESGLDTSYIRLRALPLEVSLTDFVNAHKRVYVVEVNIEGQMRSLVRLHVPEHSMSIRSVAHLDGLPLTANFIKSAILEQEHQ
ncbi:MAG: 2-oxoacid:acceptor oxidoreductase subunit alpha [Chloroflexota bacterium]|nr:2-oxoacid:acceptor oxidoreductase subunit alpha [Chloroflexota bacterium]